MANHRPKIPTRVRLAVYRRAKWRYQYYGLKFRPRHDGRAPMRELGMFLECDHVVPYSAGGVDDWRNMRAACSRCNRRRHVDIDDLWATKVLA